MDKYNDTIAVINKMAMVKMHMNRHKGNIEDCDKYDIMNMLKSEVVELEEAIQTDDILDVIQEAADVHNFLIALVHKKIEEYRTRK